MIKRRRRFKQSTTLQERLNAFANEARKRASELQPCPERQELLKKARLADTAAHIDGWIRSPELQSPT